jgi:hypothetical protein
MVTAGQLANRLWDIYADAEEAPAGTAAAAMREMCDADVAQTHAKYARVSARRAAVDRAQDDLATPLPRARRELHR